LNARKITAYYIIEENYEAQLMKFLKHYWWWNSQRFYAYANNTCL